MAQETRVGTWGAGDEVWEDGEGMTPSITVTGADEQTDLAELGKLDCEVGILYSATPEGRNRYPRLSWIEEALEFLPNASLHVCGKTARDQVVNARPEITRAVNAAKRIQVNGTLTTTQVYVLLARYEKPIITQHNALNDHLCFIRNNERHELLVDASGGRGISPEKWELPDTNKVVGFAGGLGPMNLKSELARIIELPQVRTRGFWVDMEGKLRVDDWFLVALAEDVVGQFHEATSELLDICAENTSGCICQGCGRRYDSDLIVQDDVWNKIRPDGKPEGAGLLCGTCIIQRLQESYPNSTWGLIAH